MTLTIQLPTATMEKVQAEATASGKVVATWVRDTVEKKLAEGRSRFMDIAAPVHAEFIASGMTDVELDELVDAAIGEARATRRSRGEAR